MSTIIKRRIPMVLMLFIGVIMLSEWFTPTSETKALGAMLSNWSVIVSAFAIGLGAIGLYRLHWRYLSRREPGQWQYSLVSIIVLTLYIVVGVGTGVTSSTYRWMYSNVILPLGGAVFASVSFYIASAAYRAMRARNIEAGILLVTGLIMLVATAPIGSVIWDGFPIIGNWILDTIGTGTYRAFTVGIGVGFIAMAIRTLLGLESGWLGRRE